MAKSMLDQLELKTTTYYTLYSVQEKEVVKGSFERDGQEVTNENKKYEFFPTEEEAKLFLFQQMQEYFLKNNALIADWDGTNLKIKRKLGSYKPNIEVRLSIKEKEIAEEELPENIEELLKKPQARLGYKSE